MEKIYNLTNHIPTEEQKQDGIVELPPTIKAEIRELINFEELPSKEELQERAQKITRILLAHNIKKVLIGGAVFFMPILVWELNANGITPYASFSKRDVEEYKENDTVIKKVKFKHIGLIELKYPIKWSYSWI